MSVHTYIFNIFKRTEKNKIFKRGMNQIPDLPNVKILPYLLQIYFQ